MGRAVAILVCIFALLEPSGGFPQDLSGEKVLLSFEEDEIARWSSNRTLKVNRGKADARAEQSAGSPFEWLTLDFAQWHLYTGKASHGQNSLGLGGVRATVAELRSGLNLPSAAMSQYGVFRDNWAATFFLTTCGNFRR